MEEIIEDVRRNITPKTFFWACPVAFELQKYDYSLAIRWAVECIKIYGREFNQSKFEVLSKYIQQVDERDNLTCEQCLEICREIWYLPEREDLQTAVSHLWGALGRKYGEEDGKYRAREIGLVVEVLLPDVSNRDLLDRYLGVALLIYQEYKACN